MACEAEKATQRSGAGESATQLESVLAESEQLRQQIVRLRSQSESNATSFRAEQVDREEKLRKAREEVWKLKKQNDQIRAEFDRFRTEFKVREGEEVRTLPLNLRTT